MNDWVQCSGCGLRHSVRADLQCPRCHAPDPGTTPRQAAPPTAAIAAGPAGVPAAGGQPPPGPGPKPA